MTFRNSIDERIQPKKKIINLLEYHQFFYTHVLNNTKYKNVDFLKKGKGVDWKTAAVPEPKTEVEFKVPWGKWVSVSRVTDEVVEAKIKGK